LYLLEEPFVASLTLASFVLSSIFGLSAMLFFSIGWSFLTEEPPIASFYVFLGG
jgi:hypothetical protein